MSNDENKQAEETKTNYFEFSEVLTYFFRKKDPNRPKNINIRAMHFVNKLSMLLFLGAVIFLIVRAIMRG